jgi:hypothetical protein
MFSHDSEVDCNREIGRNCLPDRNVFYIWSRKAEGTHVKFTFRPRYAINAKAAPATLSDYYNPDLKVVLAPQTFSAIDPGGNGALHGGFH